MNKGKEKIEEITKCPTCDSTNLRKDEVRAELVCEDCGLVVDDNFIDHGPEWRAFDSEQREKRARVGPPLTPTIHDKGLSTIIGWEDRDSYGKLIPTKSRAQLYRLRKWQRRIRINKSTERNLAIALSEINRMASLLGLQRDVRETASIIYRKAVRKKLIRGRGIEAVASAALYAACRQCKVPRTLNEIAATSSYLSRKGVGRAYRFIAKELGLKLMPTSPTDYISRFCNELKLSRDVQVKAIEILKEAADKELISGRGPVGITASALYIASILCGERRTQRDIADVSGVTEVTIRNRYRELAEKLDIDVSLF